MKYDNITEGRFISRPNRFIAEVLVFGEICRVHVKNTGRCRELLAEGATVFLEKSQNPERKTAYDLVAVKKGDRLINMDSQAPNKAVFEAFAEGVIFEDLEEIHSEKAFQSSRFDFFGIHGGKKFFAEVKGVTLEENGVVRFPDAPTERGVKHLKELENAVKAGFEAYAIFVVQMKDVRYFEPNVKTHPEFAEALMHAEKSGVEILCYDCEVSADGMKLGDKVEIRL